MNDDSTGLGWEDPSVSRTGYDWDAIAQMLRAEPMRWRKIFEHGPLSTANSVRQGGVKVLRRDLGFEFKSRNNTGPPDRTCTFYIRFNPEKVK